MRAFPLMFALLVCSLLPAKAGERASYFLVCDFAYHGEAKIKMSAHGARVDLKELQIFIQPDNTARIYNLLNRKWCVLSENIFMDNVKNVRWSAIKQGRTENWWGHKVTQYYADVYEINPHLHKVYEVEFKSARDFQVPQAVCDRFSALLNLPPGYGLVLYQARYYPEHPRQAVVCMSTKSAIPYELSSVDLSEPSRFQFCKDDLDVIIGQSNDEMDKVINQKSSR